MQVQQDVAAIVGKQHAAGRWLSGTRPTSADGQVTDPIPIEQPKPRYTSLAMRAKIEGAVMVQCVIDTTGIPSDCRIVRSLDPLLGLDEEALKTTRQWRFNPGTLRGKPVAVQVLIEMKFTMR
jgi:protein TonB